MLLLIVLLVSPVPPSAPMSPEAAVLDAPTRHVRIVSLEAQTAFREGYHRSATFAAMVDRLQASDVVVYVTSVPQIQAPLRARLQLVSASPSHRYVRTEIVRAVTRDGTIALLAHELRHAVEIADASDVVDEAGMNRLYRRIGTCSGPETFETENAMAIERQVRRELARRAA